MRRIAAVFAALVFVPLGAAAQATVAPFSLPSARMAALGGPHAAATSGLDAIFENPAGFASEETEFGAASLVLNPSGPIFDIVGMLVSGGDPLADLTALFDDNGRLYMQTDILGPLAFGYAGKGLGFGLFNRTMMTLDASSLMSVRYAVSEEFLLAGGYAYRFILGDRQTLDLGVMPKGFIRATVEDDKSLSEVIDLASDPTALLASPFTMTSGIGVDLGVTWSFDDMLSVGLVARDAYSPAMVTTYADFSAFSGSPGSGTSAYAVVPADLSIGVAYEPSFAMLDRLGADLLLLFDYADILDLFSIIPRNPILNVRAGVELTLLEILSLRAGIKDALPTAGFGIDLSAFTFSLAMYGKELGLDPGSRPVFNLLVAFDFKY